METTKSRAKAKKSPSTNLTHLYDKKVGDGTIYSALIIVYKVKGNSRRHFYSISFDKSYLTGVSKVGAFNSIDEAESNAMSQYLNICANVWTMNQLMASKLNQMFNTKKYTVAALPMESYL